MTSRSAFDRFVLPARANPALWRFILGLLLAVVIYVVWAFGVVFLSAWLSDGGGTPWLERVAAADEPRSMLVLLASFGGMMLGPMVAARVLGKRSPRTLFGPGSRTLRDFAVAAAVVGMLLSLSLVAWSAFFDGVANVAPARWVVLLAPALLGVLLQTGAEEVLFRGYIVQGLAARFRSPLIWMVLPAVLFGLVHFDPLTAGANAWLVVASAGLFGLLATDLVVQTGSIGAAWGFHFANNALALLIIATDGTLTGLALFVTPYSADDVAHLPWLIPIDMAVMLTSWLLLRRVLAR